MITLKRRILWRLGLSLTTVSASPSLAAAEQESPSSRVEWHQTETGIALHVPLTTMLTSKQRDMIDGGFTTMSQFDIVADSGDENIGEILLWSRSCTVKFDAWDETYEVTRFQSSPENIKSDSAIVRKFNDYGDFCLTAAVPLNDILVKLETKGQKLVGRLTVQQMSAEEGARIKEWLVRQQSGLMQSLFKHMLGELALHQSLAVAITIPPIPPKGRPKSGETSPAVVPTRGP